MRRKALLVVLALLACTEAKLRRNPEPPPTPIDDKLAIQGSVCTDDPTSLEFPVKVLFIVDSTGSMVVADPPDPVTGVTNRRTAVEEVITTLLDRDPEGVGIGLITFAGPAVILTQCDQRGAAGNPVPPGVPDCVPDTDCFSQNRAELLLSTPQLDVGGGLTAYFSAL